MTRIEPVLWSILDAYVIRLTERFWKSHARSMFVACFGNKPLFLFELPFPPRDSVSESPPPDSPLDG